MPAYADLTPQVRAIVDRKAAAHVAEHGGDVKQVREFIAFRVTTTTYKPTQGTGH